MNDRPGRELTSMAQAFLTQKHAVPGWMMVSAVLCMVMVALLMRRSVMPKPTLVDPGVVTQQSESSRVAEGVTSPFKCTADGFEAAAVRWGIPFKPNRRSDAQSMCRVSKLTSTAYGIGRHMWLCRRNGEVRGVMCKWDRAISNADLRAADQEDVHLFRGVADQLFSEKSAVELTRWFIVSGPLLDQFQATTDSTQRPTVPTDMACVKDGVRISYRRIVLDETVVIHVVNFEIDRTDPDWPPAPYGDD